MADINLIYLVMGCQSYRIKRLSNLHGPVIAHILTQ
jgi:hypothetical protein